MVRAWWVLDADIEGYFDHVDHEILRGLVRRRVGNRRVLTRIGQWLRAGVVVEGRRVETRLGVPQGGVGSMVERSAQRSRPALSRLR
jgi:retron-type reverse transcriptase